MRFTRHLAANLCFGCFALGAALAQQKTISNLSIRGEVGPANQLISGFVVTGRESTPLLIRGLGPALGQFGVAQPLGRPVLRLYNARGDVVFENVGWSTRPAAEREAMKHVYGAFALPDNSDDCALLVTLNPGLYTAQLAGVTGSSGIGLIELYHGNGLGDVPPSDTHLSNISARCVVGRGEGVGIAGVRLPANRKLLIRAIGPSLAQFGVTGVLQSPKLTIIRPEIPPAIRGFSSLPAVEIVWNDNWTNQQPLKLGANPDGSLRPIIGVAWAGTPDEIRAATTRAGAFPLRDDSRDAAMLVVIDYTPMTLHVSGADGGSGVALVEIYDVDGL